ncbi:MAG: hypothetical protein V3R22_02095 [Kiloniellales bacterium]
MLQTYVDDEGRVDFAGLAENPEALLGYLDCVGEILDFYTEDFTAKTGSLVACINCYHDGPIPEDFEVRFFDHDWTLNRQP